MASQDDRRHTLNCYFWRPGLLPHTRDFPFAIASIVRPVATDVSTSATRSGSGNQRNHRGA